ncbi:hypothetical protein [Brevibacterium sp. LS14]|uniref:hypothetical protein n=1 Tax=Brevibacterium sp. LS14 TaxID=2528962 RepID=UPI00197C724B
MSKVEECPPDRRHREIADLGTIFICDFAIPIAHFELPLRIAGPDEFGDLGSGKRWVESMDDGGRDVGEEGPRKEISGVRTDECLQLFGVVSDISEGLRVRTPGRFMNLVENDVGLVLARLLEHEPTAAYLPQTVVECVGADAEIAQLIHTEHSDHVPTIDHKHHQMNANSR